MPVADAVLLGVRLCRLDRDRVDVQRQHVPRAELRRRNRQNARSGAEVEHLRAGHDQVFGRFKAKLSRRVRARAERLPRIERDLDVVRLKLDLRPERADQQALADAHGMIVNFPRFRPILFLDNR